MVSCGVIVMDRYRDLLFCECEIGNGVNQYAVAVNNASSITVELLCNVLAICNIAIAIQGL